MATAKKKVWILDGGSLVIDRSQVLWHIDVGTPVRFPVYSVLIEHPDGLFMYDTGYDLDHVNRVLPFELPEQTSDQTIPVQLKACGFDPEQVGFVVNSHFHFDHVGGNKYLTGATTLVNTAELRHAKVPEPFEHLGYSDLSFDFPGTRYERISGDIEIADGIWLFETPGPPTTRSWNRLPAVHDLAGRRSLEPGQPARRSVRLRGVAAVDPAPRRPGRHRSRGRLPGLGGGALDHRPDAHRRRRPHPALSLR